MGQQRIATMPVATTSGDVLSSQAEQLRRLFPECVSEGKVDFDKLRATLGGAVDVGPNRFNFTWAGKEDAIALLQTPSRGTLVPDPAESIDFDTTKNIFIEGQNLEVLKLLFKPYFGRVKLIYIDPPYNTGNDFVYPDDYADPLNAYLVQTKQIDDDGNLVTNKIDRAGRIHSGWLSMMYPRLFLARQLLCEDGVIAVSIDDNEVHHLRMLMNEVFGEENFVATVIWQHSVQGKNDAKDFSLHHNYVLLYSRSEEFERRALARTEEHNKAYSNSDNDPRGDWRSGDVRSPHFRENLRYVLKTPSGKEIEPPANGWRWSAAAMQAKIEQKEVVFSADETKIVRKIYLRDQSGRVPETIWFAKDVGDTRRGMQRLKDLFGGEPPFDTPKPVELIRRICEVAGVDDGDVTLDFFAGSATTADAVLQMNRTDGGSRRFLLVQFPEPLPQSPKQSIAGIARERIRRTIKELHGDTPPLIPASEGPAAEDLGFKVFKLVAPHIRPWVSGESDRDPDAYAAKLTMFNDPLVPGWRAADVLWELALREGLSLGTRFAERKLPNGNTVHELTDPDRPEGTVPIAVCLDDKVTVDLSKHYPLTPDRVLIVRDVALDDTAAANLALQCRLKVI